MRNITNAVAIGGDFFSRLHEMEAFWRNIETDKLVLLAPRRRLVKTSLMRKIGENAGDYGFIPVFVDVSDCSDELRFVQCLYAAILEDHHGDRLSNQIKKSAIGTFFERTEKLAAQSSTERLPEVFSDQHQEVTKAFLRAFEIDSAEPWYLDGFLRVCDRIAEMPNELRTAL